MAADSIEPRPVLEPLSLGDLLDRAIRFYKQHFFKLIGVAAIPNLVGLPMAVAAAAFSLWAQRAGTVSAPPPTGQLALLGGGILVLLFVYLFVYFFVYMLGLGAGLRLVSESYLGNIITVRQAYRYAFARSPGLIWTSFVLGVLIFLGSLMCIVPGVIMMVVWIFAIHAFMLDNQSGLAALRRSRSLAEGEYGRIILLLLFVIVAYFIVLTIFQYVPMWVYMGVRAGLSADPAAGIVAATTDTVGTFLTQLLALIGGTLAAPLWIIATTLLYFDIRVRKEGYDVDVLARNLGY